MLSDQSPTGPRRVTLGWRPEIWRGLGAAVVLAQQEQQRRAVGRSRHLSSAQKLKAPADLVPLGYREEADITEHSPTWHKPSTPCQLSPPGYFWPVVLQVTDFSLFFPR